MAQAAIEAAADPSVPVRRPAAAASPRARVGYLAMLRSLVGLLRAEPVLRRRSLTAALGCAALSVF